MKDFDTLTDAEIVALTDEQRQHYRDLACAEAGAPLATPQPVAPTVADVEDDITAYVVGSFKFATPEGAAAVAELVNKTPHYDTHYLSGAGYRQYAELKTDHEVVTPTRLLSLQAATSKRDAINEFQRQKTQYEADKKEFERVTQARTNATYNVNCRIHNAFENEQRRASLREQFARYLQLAEGNAAMATRFLIRAYPNANELIPELLVESEILEGPPPAAAAVVDAGDDIQF